MSKLKLKAKILACALCVMVATGCGTAPSSGNTVSSPAVSAASLSLIHIYGGGIKVLDGYRLDRKYLNPAQQHLLKRLAKTLSGQDRDIMESILRDFALKNEDGM